ncbi:7550_t:CDS:2 [Gigaspora margarita]|uniref:7550_t:CDS:1 n=2 Tax=Gigaspora margarita TaxID=4874 RepID=A0ABN7UYU0_GIGMA|nr:putative cruciform DNA binding protein [Gigaspora margarita]CAG8696024.1 7550_t:CDS:2 [Gigaspora margarita]
MSEPSKTDATLKYYGGATKETVGKTVGSDKMEAEGRERKIEGQSEYEAAKATGKTEGDKDQKSGEVKKATGNTIGDTQMKAEGKATEMKGQAERKVNE